MGGAKELRSEPQGWYGTFSAAATADDVAHRCNAYRSIELVETVRMVCATGRGGGRGRVHPKSFVLGEESYPRLGRELP